MVRRYNAFLLLRLVGALVALPTFYAVGSEVTVGVNGGTIVYTASGTAGQSVGTVHIQGTRYVDYQAGVTCGTSYPAGSGSGGAVVGTFNSGFSSTTVSGTGTFTISAGLVGPNDGHSWIVWDAHPYDSNNNPINSTWVVVTGTEGWNWQRNGHCNEGGSSPQGTASVVFSNSPHSAHFTGSVKVNCGTQHALGLTINGVQISYQVTSVFATKDAPSTVTVSYSCGSGTIDCAEGKPWIFSVDGAASQSGTITYAGGTTDYNVTLNVNGKGSVSNPVFFDCAPPAGTLALNGTLTIPPSGSSHTLSVKVKGATVASTSSPGGAGTQTAITLTKVVENVSNGDLVEWYVDGVLVKSENVALNCSYNAEMQQTYCSGTSTYSGTATQNASPTPTATARPTPSPTAPPQNPTYTPPPPPTYSPPTSSGTTAGDVTVMNPQDIYKPILDALKVDNTGTASRNNSAAGTGADFSARGHLDDLQPQVQQAVEKVDAIKTKGVAAITGLKDSFATLPTSLGTVTSVNFGTGLFNNVGPTAARFTTLPTNVDLTPYMTGINLARMVMLWALTIYFGFLTVRAFTWTQ